MPTVQLDIIPLAEKTEYLETVINWNVTQWGSYLKDPVTETRAQYQERLNTDQPPITYVVLLDKTLIGTFSLIDDFYHFYNDKIPRLFFSRLIIAEKHRNKGYSKLILHEAEKLAAKFGYDKLHLFALVSEDLESYYKKLEWKTIETREWNGVEIIIMEHDIPF